MATNKYRVYFQTASMSMGDEWYISEYRTHGWIGSDAADFHGLNFFNQDQLNDTDMDVMNRSLETDYHAIYDTVRIGMSRNNLSIEERARRVVTNIINQGMIYDAIHPDNRGIDFPAHSRGQQHSIYIPARIPMYNIFMANLQDSVRSLRKDPDDSFSWTKWC